MFHVSDIQKFQQCPHLYAYTFLKPRNIDRNKPVHVRMSEAMNVLAGRKLKITEAYFGQTGDSGDKALQALKENEWLIRARFVYQELRVTIPFLHQTEAGYDVYFARSELYPKEEEAQYMADSLWVLKQLHIPLNQYYIIHLNHEYVRQDELDYDALLTISDHFYNQKNHPGKEIRAYVEERTRDLQPILTQMAQFNASSLSLPQRNNRCTRRYKCNYYDTCFPEEAALPDNSILHLTSSEYKYDMYREGLLTLKETDPDRIEGNRQQYAQIMADKNGGIYVDKRHLSSWLKDKLTFPLAFLDFEWDCYGVPPYKGMRPFDVLLFQYSLHVLSSPEAELTHAEFIGVEDCRKELLVDLLAKLPKEGSIIAFNGIGAEELRLNELAQLYPEYTMEIQAVLARMVDFSLPFTLGMIYDVRMRGFYSLKQIVEALDEDVSYKTLDISQAMSAVYHWRQLETNTNSADEQKIIEELLAYCAMDTYSLYLLYRWFHKLCQ